MTWRVRSAATEPAYRNTEGGALALARTVANTRGVTAHVDQSKPGGRWITGIWTLKPGETTP